MVFFVLFVIGAVVYVLKYSDSSDRERAFKKSEFERGAMFVIDFHHLNGNYPSHYVRNKVYYNKEYTVDSFDLSTERGRINARLDTATQRENEEEMSRWKDSVEKAFWGSDSVHNLDSFIIVTAIDSQGRVVSFIGSSGPYVIPQVDTSFYKIIKK